MAETTPDTASTGAPISARDRRKALDEVGVLPLERFDVTVSPDFYWTDAQPRIVIMRSGQRQPSHLPELTLTLHEAAQLATWLRSTVKRVGEVYRAQA